MVDQLISLLCLGVMALASYGLGRPVVRGLGVGQEDRLSATVWTLATGLIVAGMALAGLGLLGILYVPLIGALSAAAAAFGIGQLRYGRRSLGEEGTHVEIPAADPFEPSPSACSGPRPWISRSVLFLAGLACLGSLVGALAPPTAGDALCYHLELPKTFLADHGIRYLPYSENSTYPLLAEMWYLWGLALDGGVTAQLVHWGLGLLLGLATVVLATPIVGRGWAWIAGAVVLLVPGVNNQMTAPLNDVALALLTTLALAAWWRGVVGAQGRRWLVLAGLAAGGALGTKYLALVFAAAVAIASAWDFFRHPQRRRLLAQGGAIVAIVAVSVGGLWYLRAAWHRGNPVYPFFSEVLENENPGGAEQHETLPKSKAPLGRSLGGCLAGAWHVTMHPERFGGRGHQLGALFLAALPGLFLARRLRGLGSPLAVVLAYWLLWYLLRQNVRFLLPVVPLLAVAVVWVGIEIGRFPTLPRRLAAVALGGILAASAAVALVRSRDQLAAAVGLESRDDYLFRQEPTYLAAHLAAEWLGSDARLLSQDYRGYYFPCRVTRENVYRRRTHYDRKLRDPADLSRILRDAGFTHLLLAENLTWPAATANKPSKTDADGAQNTRPETPSGRGIQYDPTLTQLVEAAYASDGGHSLLQLAEYRFGDADGGVRRYRLVMLR